MPTKDELNMIYKNREEVGGFALNYYWSSTEFDNDDAWVQDFLIGYQNVYGKSNDYYVRAVRAS